MRQVRAASLSLSRFAPVLGFAIGSLVLGVALAQNTASHGLAPDTAGLKHAQLRGVASSRVFDNVNRNDVRAALKTWFDAVGQRKGYVLDSTVDIVDSVAQIKQRLQSHSVELVTMGVPDYLELESSNLVVPLMTDERTQKGGPQYAYLLLVNPASGITSVSGLRGRNVLISARGSGETGMAWLDVLLGKERLGRASSFLASVKPAAKPQSCILPVFFGTADACVVDEINLNLAKEMNPQLGKLTVLARSRPMIESVIAVTAESEPYQSDLIRNMLTLHEDPRGRQMLMVFKTDRIVRLQPGDLDSARELWRDYYRLPGPHHTAGFGLDPSAEHGPGNFGKGGN